GEPAPPAVGTGNFRIRSGVQLRAGSCHVETKDGIGLGCGGPSCPRTNNGVSDTRGRYTSVSCIRKGVAPVHIGGAVTAIAPAPSSQQGGRHAVDSACSCHSVGCLLRVAGQRGGILCQILRLPGNWPARGR